MFAEFVPPDLLASVPGWSPRYFAGSTAVALRASQHGSTLEERGAEVLEGWRVSETPGAETYDPRVATTPVYRQANVGRLRLQLEPKHWETPQIAGRWCVQPGDVVLNKIAPVRAAFVPPHAKRHPVDGNVLVIRGLPRAEAVWVALCLNQRGYEQRLVIESGAFLERVGLGALTGLRLPPMPHQMESLSAQLRDALEQQMLASEALHHIRAEAEAATRDAPVQTHDLALGAVFPANAVTNDSWLPKTTALRAEQAELEAEHAWVSVDKLATLDDRARMSAVPEAARALRLSDVGEDLFVPSLGGSSTDVNPTRTLARELLVGEVLLSTVGTSFRVAYVDEGLPPHTYPVDGWARFRFHETPAAWAVLLATASLRTQATRLAIGTVQQFVPPEALRNLRLPAPPREVRERWQRAVERHHAHWRVLEREWSGLLEELSRVFEAVHRPFADAHARSREKGAVQ